MVELTWIELATFWVQIRCSPRWATAPYIIGLTISWDNFIKWSGKQDSNLRPPDPKSGALPSCAISRVMARQARLELATFRFVVWHSIQLSYWRNEVMEVPNGFEPMIIELQSIALPAWLRNHVLTFRKYKSTKSKRGMQELFFNLNLFWNIVFSILATNMILPYFYKNSTIFLHFFNFI